MRGRFRHGIGTPRSERRILRCGRIARIPEALSRASVVKTNRTLGKADCFQKIESTDRDTLHGFHGLLERQTDGALSCEVIDFVWVKTLQSREHASKVIRLQRDRLQLIV